MMDAVFQSTRPVRGATDTLDTVQSLYEFQSTRPVRGATKELGKRLKLARVSIHAPRAGRDIVDLLPCISPHCFNPRAPCGARPL